MVQSVSFSGKMLLYEGRNPKINNTEDAMYNACERVDVTTKRIQHECRLRKVPIFIIPQIEMVDVFNNGDFLTIDRLPKRLVTNAIWTGADALEMDSLTDKNFDITKAIEKIKQIYSVSDLLAPIRKNYFDYKGCKPMSILKRFQACLMRRIF